MFRSKVSSKLLSESTNKTHKRDSVVAMHTDNDSFVHVELPSLAEDDGVVLHASGRSNTQAKCGFLEAIPLEVRLQIYAYLLSDNLIVYLGINGLWRPVFNGPNRKSLWPAILATNSQIKNEAAAVLYGSNTFYLGSAFALSEAIPSSKLPAHSLKLMKRLVTHEGVAFSINEDTIFSRLQSYGIDFQEIVLFVVSFKGSSHEYEQCVRRTDLLKPTDRGALERYVSFGGDGGWLESGRFLAYWGQH